MVLICITSKIDRDLLNPQRRQLGSNFFFYTCLTANNSVLARGRTVLLAIKCIIPKVFPPFRVFPLYFQLAIRLVDIKLVPSHASRVRLRRVKFVVRWSGRFCDETRYYKKSVEYSAATTCDHDCKTLQHIQREFGVSTRWHCAQAHAQVCFCVRNENIPPYAEVRLWVTLESALTTSEDMSSDQSSCQRCVICIPSIKGMFVLNRSERDPFNVGIWIRSTLKRYFQYDVPLSARDENKRKWRPNTTRYSTLCLHEQLPPRLSLFFSSKYFSRFIVFFFIIVLYNLPCGKQTKSILCSPVFRKYWNVRRDCRRESDCRQSFALQNFLK